MVFKDPAITLANGGACGLQGASAVCMFMYAGVPVSTTTVSPVPSAVLGASVPIMQPNSSQRIRTSVSAAAMTLLLAYHLI
jgi:phosphate/sulfate permease